MHSNAKVALAAAVALALAAAVAWQEQVIARTRSQNRERMSLLARVTSAPNADTVSADYSFKEVLDEHTELERLRGLAATLRSQLGEARTTREAALVARGQSQMTPRPGFAFARDAQNAGCATPAALFQTLLWALGNGQTNALLDLADWSSDGAQRQKEIMLREFASNGQRMQDMQFRVVREVPLPDGDAAVVIDIARAGSVHRDAVLMRRVNAGWLLLVDKDGPQTVDLGAELNRE